MKSNLLSTVYIVILVACYAEKEDQTYLGQGMMAGEVTTSSVILQARLTTSDALIDGDLPGKRGVGKFEVSTDRNFTDAINSSSLIASKENDFMVKTMIRGLQSGTSYFYRLQYGTSGDSFTASDAGTFKTLVGEDGVERISFAAVTGMNYYAFYYGDHGQTEPYAGPDKDQGYPALETILDLAPDYFIGTGDNVYFDEPNRSEFERKQNEGKNPHPGGFDGEAVIDETGMRKKYHQQFIQQRFRELFKKVPTYWEKDDHDYRFNDSDPYRDFPITHEIGAKNWREQLPVVDPDEGDAKPYRTHRMNEDLQIWLVEGREYRSHNKMEDGPEKTIWGKEQLAWLKTTLSESDATFKILISATPMVGPDDSYKTDNHTNLNGFRYEGEAFFNWLNESGFSTDNFFIVCGDRHWQYHALHPSGFEEFSCGALVDANSRAGRVAGDPDSTDPEAKIKQFYVQGTPESASGGFLLVAVERDKGTPQATFSFYDEKGKLNYQVVKQGVSN